MSPRACGSYIKETGSPDELEQTLTNHSICFSLFGKPGREAGLWAKGNPANLRVSIFSLESSSSFRKYTAE